MSFIFSPSMIYAPIVRFQNCQESKIIFKTCTGNFEYRKEVRMECIRFWQLGIDYVKLWEGYKKRLSFPVIRRWSPIIDVNVTVRAW